MCCLEGNEAKRRVEENKENEPREGEGEEEE